MEKQHGIGFYIAIILAFGFLSMLFAGIIALFTTGPTGNVALIPIKGIIVGDSMLDGAASSDITEMIEDADQNENIKAIIFEIDSPGGMVVPTDEIAQAIKKTNKTTAAWIRSIGASGAYWIASSTDRIFANRMSIVGSIGVFSSYLDFSGLMDDYNVTYNRLVSGKYKDMGSPFKEITEEEENIFQTISDQIWDEFIREIAQNRNIPEEDVRNIATGRVFLGTEAKELKLIDEFGGIKDIEDYLKEQLNLTEITLARYEREQSLLELISSVRDGNYYSMGEGIGASLVTKSQEPSFPKVWS